MPKTHTYNDGRPYVAARGRKAERKSLENRNTTIHSIVSGYPTAEEFLKVVRREMKIRCYQRATIKQYCSRLSVFLVWFGGRPNCVRIETVRNFLEFLVDSGASSATLAGYLASIRMAFDKFCGRSVTLGLETPRKRKRIPPIPNRTEIRKLIDATENLRDRLLIELMYASGFRVSEVARLEWSEIDFQRSRIRITSGKGNVDRIVLLPDTCFASMFGQFNAMEGRGLRKFVFEGECPRRHVSIRTIERVVERARMQAKIIKPLSPHSLRHAFATHLLENGTDIQFVQKLLGHVRLETTTIYTRTAKTKDVRIKSPLDDLPICSSN